MSQTTIRFQSGTARWVHERNGVIFHGIADGRTVDFLITSEALAQLEKGRAGHLGRDEALRVFRAFEADIHRMAGREFSRRSGSAPMLFGWRDVRD
jgi:hypothetical protein